MTKPATPNGLRLLFADDEPSMQQLMNLELPRMGHEVLICSDGTAATIAIEENEFDAIIVDIHMPGMTGLEVIERLRAVSPDTEAVVYTGNGDEESAVRALRLGAADYLHKPCKLSDIQALLTRIAERRELKKKFHALERRLQSIEGAPQLVGDSPAMQRVNLLIDKVAPTESTVLVLGETGTGKELVARAVHDRSARADQPFVAINCGALPENLIESELFGHARGAFTGADEHRTGLFEVASGGTIFLDEIGELPKAMQAKLLRVLESREIRRVGENKTLTVDVRVVCATHRDLSEMVAEEAFREDLMYRINTFELRLPALRERIDDLPPLAEHLLRRFRPGAKPIEQLFTDDAIRALSLHVWPGNVRELANVVEHATILCDAGPITAADLPSHFSERRLTGAALARGPMTLRELEMQAIHDALERHAGAKPKAAAELGISLKTLYNKLNQEAATRAAA
ncbi:MAG: sigma-54 dependent transcriptional regulator [Planctomycetota bacterium]